MANLIQLREYVARLRHRRYECLLCGHVWTTKTDQEDCPECHGIYIEYHLVSTK